jgi:phenylacetate-CoA ligase
MKRYWDEKIETLPPEEMRRLQLKKLQETLHWLWERVPFYKDRFKEAGVEPKDFQSLEDLVHLPFTVKTDLRDQYPLGLCAVPSDELASIHASSGTTGKPIIGPYTHDDLDQWTDCTARIIWGQGVRSSDICQNALGMGLFTGGLGIHQGIRRIGCGIVPSGIGMTERQLMLLQDLRVTVLFSTPSYGMTILEKGEKMGIDLKALPLKICCFGGEPFTEELRKEMELRAGVKAYEMYGLTEMMGPGVGGTCEAHRLHINEDHIYPEVIDPISEKVLPEGEKGELVFTSLQRQAMPLIRYKSRDISTLRRITCECGRTLVTIDKILGRSDDMLNISGVNVYPSQVESVLLEFEEIEPVYQIRIFKKGYLDGMAVEVEVKPEVYSSGRDFIEELGKKVSDRLHQVIGITIPVAVLETEAIPRSQGKAIRVIDERK